MPSELQSKSAAPSTTVRSAARSRVVPGSSSHYHHNSMTEITRDSNGHDTTAAPPRATARDFSSVVREWKQRHAFWGRYSLWKLQALSDYQHAHHLRRSVAMLCLAPVPAIVMLALLLAIPLDDPSLGPSRNGVTMLRSAISHIGASFCITLAVKQALELDDRAYSYRRCLLLACLASGINESIWTAVSFAWRFPVPFREPLCASTWLVWFFLVHYALLRDTFARKQARMRLYLPVFTVQFSVFYVFLLVAVAFAFLGPIGQALVVLAVAPFKMTMKRLVWHLARQLDDLSTDVTVCVVELSAAMYQSLVMQSACSAWIPALMFAVDLAQAALELALHFDHGFLVSGQIALVVATDLIAQARVLDRKQRNPTLRRQESESLASTRSTAGAGGSALPLDPGSSSSALVVPPPAAIPEEDSMLADQRNSRRSIGVNLSPQDTNPQGSSGLARTGNASSKVARAVTQPSKPSDSARSSQFLDFRPSPSMRHSQSRFQLAKPPATTPEPVATIIDGLTIHRASDARLLTQLLRLLFACEMLLFVEFLEVLVALLYFVGAALAWVLPGGKYLLPLMGLAESEFAAGLARAGLHLALEGVSFALVFWQLQRKCGLSTLYHVAYVLEHYWMTIQGKLLACLLLLVNLATLQQGTDVRFQFDYSATAHA